MSTHVVLYTKPGCGPCMGMKAALERVGIAFEIVDLSTNEAALRRVRELGYQQAPVVDAGSLHWSGMRPDKVHELATRLALEPAGVNA
ncbi:glutaredoxin family protein [Streptomyces sp. ISL-90]|nr:glutaredoxin family protein [Streptomyces sp. ISL-90]